MASVEFITRLNKNFAQTLNTNVKNRNDIHIVKNLRIVWSNKEYEHS